MADERVGRMKPEAKESAAGNEGRVLGELRVVGLLPFTGEKEA